LFVSEFKRFVFRVLGFRGFGFQVFGLGALEKRGGL
jgi:hypothetical protein